MEKQDLNIHIIGAGISGLVAATVLEEHGFSPTIIEATDRPGGRVKTDIIDGYQLDHGFQVLLTAYPAAKKYLNLDALELQKFKPGAAIFKDGKQTVIGDPLRDFSLLFPTLFAGVISASDKFKILKLNTLLKKKDIAAIFADTEQTTSSYLENFGFTKKTIDNFFKPFFSGIFLENKLKTSSRMFEFVYKMFGTGYAALPKTGIEAIPRQLAAQLKNTEIKYNTKVMSLKDGEITLENNTTLESDFTIVATEASSLISNLKNQAPQWKSCDTLYFEVGSRNIKQPLIGLISENSALINNIFFHTSLGTSTNPKKELLSVTVVDNQGFDDEILLEKVKTEIELYCNISEATFIKHYKISKALPQLENLQYEISPTETRLTAQLFLAGDVLLNGSLNAAMLAGESAAIAVIEAAINGKKLTE